MCRRIRMSKDPGPEDSALAYQMDLKVNAGLMGSGQWTLDHGQWTLNFGL